MANSITILPITSYLESRPQPVTGSQFQGDGFFSRNNPTRTVQWKLYNFVGDIGLQGSLSSNPTESDWFLINLGKPNEFTIDTTGRVSSLILPTVGYSEATSGVFGFNFSGNFVWLRAYINNWTAGNVDSVIISS